MEKYAEAFDGEIQNNSFENWHTGNSHHIDINGGEYNGWD
jgi:hypothetical protein